MIYKGKLNTVLINYSVRDTLAFGTRTIEPDFIQTRDLKDGKCRIIIKNQSTKDTIKFTGTNNYIKNIIDLLQITNNKPELVIIEMDQI